MRISNLCIALTFLTLFLSCTEALDLEIDEPADLLVVDGLISDQNEAYTVKLTRSAAFSSVLQPGGFSELVDGALVTVVDNLGRSFVFSQSSSGIYTSNAAEFTGSIGSTYILNIRLPNGQEYSSLPETLVNRATFDTLNTIKVTKETVSGQGRIVDVQGIELSVDFTMDQEDDSFVRWKVRYNTNDGLRELERIIVMNGSEFSSSAIPNTELDFVYRKGLYEAEVIMYSISENSYNFWELGSKQQNNGGTIFESAPVQLTGNIFNVNDPDEKVLGLFSAASTSSKSSIFIID